MKIAILAPPFLPIPPIGYGGTEKIIDLLTEGLVKKGQDVTLFASGDSKTHAKLVPIIPESLGNSGYLKDDYLTLTTYYIDCLKQSQEFDIIHNHGAYLPLLLSAFITTPIVHTLHGSYYENETPLARREVLLKMKKSHFISISNNQRQGLPELNYLATVYNAVDTNLFSFKSENQRSYAVWVGRITAKKGTLFAIKAAMQANIPLHLAATIDPIEQEYFDKEIKPYIDRKIIHLHLNPKIDELIDLYQNAMCTFMPITWHEPFGLTMIESMACGTPVVAYNIGSVPEVVVDGETGFIINNESQSSSHYIISQHGEDGLAAAVNQIKKMSLEQYMFMRKKSRIHVENKFSTHQMVEGYLSAYKKICQV